MTTGLAIKLLLLLLAANGTPVVAKRWLGDKWTFPLDAGLKFIDGRRLLGRSKTFRGVVVGVLACAVVAVLLGFTWQVGALFGFLSLCGDASSSFIKRRLDISPSGMALGLDQIPEALLPLLLLRGYFGLDLTAVCLLVALFFVGELLLSRIMFQLGVRDHPY